MHPSVTPSRRRIWLLLVGGWLGLATLVAAAPSDEAVATRIAILQQHLVNMQRTDGSWDFRGYTVGATALAGAALAHSGLPAEHPAVAKAAHYVATHTDVSGLGGAALGRTYSEGLVPCFLELLGPVRYKDRITNAAHFLEGAMTPAGDWSYGADGAQGGDNSNTQFAILGLAAAERCGVVLNAQVKEAARNHWLATQNGDGGWGYHTGQGSTFAMTCAGIASLQVLGVEYEKKEECGGKYTYHDKLTAALKRLSAYVNDPRATEIVQQSQGNYGLYALERVGIFLGLNELGGVSWYRWGAEVVLNQEERPGFAEACFALLFLARGCAPIAIAKWEWNGDYNNQHQDVYRWVQHAGAALDRRFDCVTAKLGPLDSPAAKASLIFANGRDAFRATDEEIDFLRSFLEEGGTFVAEATCNSREFAAAFEKILCERLYPEYQATFVPVDQDHPSAYLKFPVDPALWGARRLECGCRNTKVILLTKSLSCALNGDRDALASQPEAIKFATNLLAWALADRNAEKKLDEAKLKPIKGRETLTPDQLRRMAARTSRQFRQPLGRLRYEGDWAYAIRFTDHLRQLMAVRADLPFCDGEVFVDAGSNDLFQSAALFLTGHRPLSLPEADRLNLRTYLQNGGFLLVCAACSSEEFDRSFRGLLTQVLPNDQLEEVPEKDPLWTRPFALAGRPPQVTKAYEKRFGTGWGKLYGVRREGRWVVVYSPVDFCSDLADGIPQMVAGYRRESAFQLVANVLAYAFTP